MGWRLAVYAALLLAATAGMIRWQSPPDPFYYGKRLSQYLYEVRPGLGPGGGQRSRDGRFVAQEPGSR